MSNYFWLPELTFFIYESIFKLSVDKIVTSNIFPSFLKPHNPHRNLSIYKPAAAFSECVAFFISFTKNLMLIPVPRMNYVFFDKGTTNMKLRTSYCGWLSYVILHKCQNSSILNTGQTIPCSPSYSLYLIMSTTIFTSFALDILDVKLQK